jgi:hypothetical protein
MDDPLKPILTTTTSSTTTAAASWVKKERKNYRSRRKKKFSPFIPFQQTSLSLSPPPHPPLLWLFFNEIQFCDNKRNFSTVAFFSISLLSAN